MPLEPVFVYGEITHRRIGTSPVSGATAPVWILFYHGLANIYLNEHIRDFKSNSVSNRTEYLTRSLELLLEYEIDRDVLFVAGIPSPTGIHDLKIPLEDSEDSDSLMQRIAFDLLELLEVMAPANLETLRTKLSHKKAQQGPRKIIAFDESTIIHRKGTLSSFEKNWSRRYIDVPCIVESVITPSERLDVPFSFRYI